MAPASVTSSPSRIQVTPSATTTRVWKRLQVSRSSRAGTSVSTTAAPAHATARSGNACANAMLATPFRQNLQSNDLQDWAFRPPLPPAPAKPYIDVINLPRRATHVLHRNHLDR